MTRRLVPAALLAVALASTELLAQSRRLPAPFAPGTKLLSAGLLIGGTTGELDPDPDGRDFDGEFTDGIGIGGQFEVGVTRFSRWTVLGLGGAAGIIVDERGRRDYVSVPITAIGNVHVTWPGIPRELDVYGGASLGLRALAVDGRDVDDENDVDPAIGIQAGARWWFSPTVAAHAQLQAGANLPFATLGVSFRF
jgi:hypothetical protein